MQELNQS